MNGITRREALTIGAATFAAAIPRAATAATAGRDQRVVTKGRLKQSVSRWSYSKIPLPEFCRAVADMGLTAIDLLEEPDWAIARATRSDLLDGLRRRRLHSRRAERHSQSRRDRPQLRADRSRSAAAQKVPNVITFFGNRRGHERRGSDRQLRRGAEPRQEDRRGSRRHDLRRAPQQQGRSQGLPGRSHRVRRRDRQGGRLAAREAALRHLPHADHGGRRDPHDPRQPATTSRIFTPAASRAGTSSTTRRK